MNGVYDHGTVRVADLPQAPQEFGEILSALGGQEPGHVFDGEDGDGCSLRGHSLHDSPEGPVRSTATCGKSSAVPCQRQVLARKGRPRHDATLGQIRGGYFSDILDLKFIARAEVGGVSGGFLRIKVVYKESLPLVAKAKPCHPATGKELVKPVFHREGRR